MQVLHGGVCIPLLLGCLSQEGSKAFHPSLLSSTNRTLSGEFVQKAFLAGNPGNPGFQDGSGDQALFHYPVTGTVAGEYLYIADSYNSVVRRVHLRTGEVKTEVGIPGKRGTRDGKRGKGLLDFPEGVATDGEYLYIADTFNHAIRSYNLATRELRTLAGDKGHEGFLDGEGSKALFNFPRGVVSLGNAVYVADTINSVIRRIDKESGEVSTTAGKAKRIARTDGRGEKARFYFPYGLGTDGGMLYVADTLNHAIRRVDPGTGEVQTVAGGKGMGFADGIGSEARFNSPFQVTANGRMLYVADTLNHAVREVSLATGEVRTLFGSSSSPIKEGEKNQGVPLNAPRGVVYGDRLYLYIIDTDNHVIRKLKLQ